jgi:lysosomal alpha-mannosidase
MTFEPWKDDSTLIRFEHLLEKNEDPELSKPVRFNLNDVFPGNDIDLKEVSLSGNQWIEEFQRLHFKAESKADFFEVVDQDIKFASVPVKDLEITLNPMEIRTFIMTLTPRV